MVYELTCVECPMGCQIRVETEEGGKIASIEGNSCPRGKLYAQNEITCPRRVITTTVRTADGRMVPVKTNAPVKKAEMREVMRRINALHPSGEIRLGDVIKENIIEDISLVATDNCPL